MSARRTRRQREPIPGPDLSGSRYVPSFLNSFRDLSFVLLLVIVALVLGMVGYKILGGMGWVDSFTNASMILAGMGPVRELNNNSAKVFAGIYALFSGLFFLVFISLIIDRSLEGV